MTEQIFPGVADDSVIGGVVPDANTTEGMQLTAALFAVARGPGQDDELVGMAAMVQQLAVAASPVAGDLVDIIQIPGRRSMFSVKMTRRALTAIASTLLVAGTAAAAASGSLPSPFVDEALPADTTVAVETTLPDDTVVDDTVVDEVVVDEAVVDETVVDDTMADGTATDAPGWSEYGHCNAWSNGPKNENAKPWADLIASAEAAGQSVEDFCADVIAAKKGAEATDADDDEADDEADEADDDADDDDEEDGDDDDDDDDEARSGKGNGKGNGNGKGKGRG